MCQVRPMTPTLQTVAQVPKAASAKRVRAPCSLHSYVVTLDLHGARGTPIWQVQQLTLDHVPGASAAANGVAAARATKQAKRVDDIWSKLRAQSGGGTSTSAPFSGTGSGGAGSGGAAAQPAHRQAGGFNLATFCRPVPKAQKGVLDEVRLFPEVQRRNLAGLPMMYLGQ